MTWGEWEELKAKHEPPATRPDAAPVGGGTYGPYVVPGRTGDLRIGHADLARIGKNAHTLYDQLWDKARVSVPSSGAAAGDLSGQGFSLGDGLRHVSDRWEEQLKSLMDACAQIANHLQTTRRIHAGDEHYIERQTTGIAALDAGFDERVGAPGARNHYGERHRAGKPGS